MLKNWKIILVTVLIVGFVIFLGVMAGNTSKSGDKNDSDMIELTTTDSGLQYGIIEEGDGQEVKSGDTVSIHYVGTLENGTKFDSSIDRGQPFVTQIGVGQVIQGWDEGVVGMKVGEKRKLVIPAELGYGSQSIGSIPANSTLIFDVELIEIQ